MIFNICFMRRMMIFRKCIWRRFYIKPYTFGWRHSDSYFFLCCFCLEWGVGEVPGPRWPTLTLFILNWTNVSAALASLIKPPSPWNLTQTLPLFFTKILILILRCTAFNLSQPLATFGRKKHSTEKMIQCDVESCRFTGWIYWTVGW